MLRSKIFLKRQKKIARTIVYFVIICASFFKNYGNNLIYFIPFATFGTPEECLAFFRATNLVPSLEKLGYDVRSASYRDDLTKAKFIICLGFPSNQHEETILEGVGQSKLSAIIIEPPVGYPRAYNKSVHRLFKYIFTWNDALVDGLKYKKIFYPGTFWECPPMLPGFDERRFCTLINGYKLANNFPNELYSWRIKAIQFFNLEFYGVGWNKNKFPTYQGAVESKNDILRKYKFCICFENQYISGWVSEKIGACFYAGCIPIYWGASNIEQIVPENCFIDMRKFKRFEDLAEYLNNFDEKKYIAMIENIRKFSASPQAKLFSYDFFTYTIIKALMSENVHKIFDTKSLSSMQHLEMLAAQIRP